MADHTLRSAVLAATMASAACFAPAMHVRAAALRNTARSSPGLRLGGAHSSAFGTRIPAAAVNAAGRAGRGVQRSGLRMQVEPGTAEAEQEEFDLAIRNTIIAVSAAFAFGAGLYAVKGPQAGFEFLTGYVVEQSLSVDNLFVFILLFQYFKVPEPLQRRVLTWGIAGAVVMRGVFITAGLVAIQTLRPVLVLFASFLIFSSYKILSGVGDEDEDEEDLSQNAVVKFSSNLLKSTEAYDGDKFFTMVDGVKRATPLLLVLVCVELSDVLFAVDSIPAVFGVTEDPLVVFTSNIFAILGLRALYNVLVKLVQDLEYLEPAVGLVLLFVGIKMIVEFLGINVPEELALAVVVTLLGGGVVASKVKNDGESDDAQ